MSECQCNNIPNSFYLADGPLNFDKELEKVKTGDWIWLGRCPECGSLWSVDVSDKLHWQVVVHLRSEDDFENDTTEIRKNLLLKFRGGNSEDKCIWAGCSNKAVKDVAYCIDHLWKTGSRR